MKNKIKSLIQRFWNGNLSSDEQQELLTRLDNEQDQIQKDLHQKFGASPDEEQLHNDEDYKRYLQQIHQKMGVNTRSVKHLSAWKKWGSIAASIAILGFSFFHWHTEDKSKLPPQVVSIEATISRSEVIENKGSQTEKHRLSDGSTVSLEPGSRLSIADRFGEGHRKMTLAGTATFEVAPDSTKPFEVTAMGYATTALGTSFVISTALKDEISVRLLTGKVVVRATSHSAYPIQDQYMIAGEELKIDIVHQTVEKHAFIKPSVNTAQKNVHVIPQKKDLPQRQDKQLHFVEAPLSKVFEQLTKQNNINFDLQDDRMNDLYFTGDFDENEHLNDILSIICGMNGLQFEFVNDTTVRIHTVLSEEKTRNQQ